LGDRYRICFVWKKDGPITSKSSTTIDRLAPVHPGEVLAADFLAPMGLSANALAHSIDVSMIAAGQRGVSRATALRLPAALGTAPEFWMNLQEAWELAGMLVG